MFTEFVLCALVVACTQEDMELDTLIESGADVNAKNNDEKTSFVNATERNFTDIIAA